MRDADFGDSDFDLSYGKSFWITIGKERVPVKDGAGSEGTLTFEVPEDFSSGTLAAQPQGSIEGYDGDDTVTKTFKQSKVLTVPISIPAG